MTILKIDRSAPFNPVTFLGEGWKVTEQDQGSLMLTEVDVQKIELVKYNASEEFPQIRLDAKVLQVLWENQHFIPESWKKEEFGYVTRVYFEGTELQHEEVGLGNLFLYWSNGEWHFSCSHHARCSHCTPAAILRM
jgi:hypothetical protein